MKVKLFTHNDLDGVGCAIVAHLAFDKENVDVTYCNYDNVSDKVMDFLNTYSGEFDHVFITDISVNEEVAARIEKIITETDNEFITLLDHHETANWLNKYDWATVRQVHLQNGRNTSGTSMLYRWLLLHSDIVPQENMNILTEGSHLEIFVENVRRYDTWDWKNIFKDDYPKQINDLFYIYGRDRFIKKAIFELQFMGFFLTGQDLIFLEIEQEKIDRSVEKSLKQLTTYNVGRYNIGVVFGEKYISEVCHALHEKHPKLDLIAMVNLSSRTISYRTNREDVDVGKFAKYFGGGGRPATAGSEISDAHIDTILNTLFQS